MEYSFKIPGEKGDRVGHYKIEDSNSQVDLKGLKVLGYTICPDRVNSLIARTETREVSFSWEEKEFIRGGIFSVDGHEFDRNFPV